MDELRTTSICIVNEKPRKISTSSQLSSTVGSQSRYCPSPATCDSGNFSNQDVANSHEEYLSIEEKLDSAADEKQKLLLLQQIIRKLKTEIHCLTKSEKWYKNELKTQKSLRLDTLEKLYINEREFLKSNQALQLECQRLRGLYTQIKVKSKREKEQLVKEIEKIRNFSPILNDNERNKEVDNYKFEKLNKIIEENESVIDLLRKQKLNLLADLQNVSAEKEAKIMMIEKENCMLVEKCKELILEMKKMRQHQNLNNIVNISTDSTETWLSEKEKFRKIVNLQELQISDLNLKLNELLEQKNNSEKELSDRLLQKSSETDNIKCLYDSQVSDNQKLKCELTKVKQIYEILQNQLSSNKKHYIEMQKEQQLKIDDFLNDVKIKENKIDDLEIKLSKYQDNTKVLLSAMIKLLNKILYIENIIQEKNKNELTIKNGTENVFNQKIDELDICQPTFQRNFEEIFIKCSNILETFKDLNFSLMDECKSKSAIILENIKSLNIYEDIIKLVLDQDTYVTCVFVCDQVNFNQPNQSNKELRTDNYKINIEKTLVKNDMLRNLLIQKLGKSLDFNLSDDEFRGLLNDINVALLEQKKLSQNTNVNYNLGCSIESAIDNKTTEVINASDDIKEVKQMLVKQQLEHEAKISKHQAHIRFLLSNIKLYKKKLEMKDVKNESLNEQLKKVEKEIHQKKLMEQEFVNKRRESEAVINSLKDEIDRYHEDIKNLKCQLKTARTQFANLDVYKNLNEEIQSHLINVMYNYKTILKKKENEYNTIKSKLDYEKINALIEKSKNTVPNLNDINHSVDQIKSDVKSILQNYNALPTFKSDFCMLPLHGGGDNLKYLSYQEQKKSLMDELREASVNN